MSTKHPHIERPTEAQLNDLLQDKSPDLRQIYLDTHRLLLETLPDVAYSVDSKDGVTGYGARQYGYDGWGLAALAAHSKWVSLMLMRGANLADPHGLLEGSGKNMRHVKLRSAKAFEERREALRQLITAAASARADS
ncbi:MAG: DUF1801 domain-containing protein [Chloroflexota bacterium]